MRSILFISLIILTPFTNIFAEKTNSPKEGTLVEEAIIEQTPIQKQYSEVLIAFRKTIGQKGSANTNKKEKKAKNTKEKVSFGTLSLPAQTQMEMALELMARLDQPLYDGKDIALFAPDTWQSLRLIDQEPSALSGIAPDMKTIFGKLFLARMLTTPTINLDRIKMRQEAIQELYNDPEKTKRIATLCGEIKELQEHLLGITNSEHPLYQKGLRIYLHDFFLRPINERSLGWNRFTKLFGDIWYAMGPIIAVIALKSIWSNYRKGTQGRWIGDKKLRDLKTKQALSQLPVLAQWRKSDDTPGLFTRTKNLIKQVFSSTQKLSNVTEDSVTTAPSGGASLESIINNNNNSPTIEDRYGMDYRKIGVILALITAYNGGIQVPGIITWIRNRIRAANYFYDQLRPLRKFFVATEELRSILETTPALKKLSDEIDATILHKDPNVLKLRKILMGPAFKNRALGHVIGGDAVLAIDLLGKCRDSVLKGIGLLGALDNYSSLAQWYTVLHTSKTNPICFAELAPAARPSLNAIDFWHVLAKENPHLNSIQLGNGTPQNAIITGIFESGKSTVLQAIALNVVCAQSIGICLAKKFVATPYASINIYANIKDDLASGRSLFKTELYRALQLLDQIKQMPAGYFSFTIADATFTGTEAGAGQAAAYAVARYLGKLHNSVALHATNFISLSILGTQDPQTFANYSLPTHLNGTTKESSYELTKGFLNPQHATAIFKEEKLPTQMIAEMEKQIALSLK